MHCCSRVIVTESGNNAFAKAGQQQVVTAASVPRGQHYPLWPRGVKIPHSHQLGAWDICHPWKTPFCCCSLESPEYANKANCTVPACPPTLHASNHFTQLAPKVAVTEACNARQAQIGRQLTASLYPTAYGWGMKFQGRENQAGGPAL